jgi:hypothetical protein
MPWTSIAFYFTPPKEVVDEESLLSAWCYLRRRSVLKGDFRAIDNEEWEEYTDRESSEYFYWQVTMISQH